MQFTYLLVNLFTISVPLIFSFHPRLRFDKCWPAFFPAVFLTAIPFLLWDMYFTAQGYWGFNPRYLLGVELGNLPLEEVLFFFCIPYACVFTYFCLTRVLWKGRLKGKAFWLTTALAAGFILIGLFNLDRSYTASTFLGLGLLLLLCSLFFRIDWLRQFYAVYGILLLPFFIVNGVLTGSWIPEEVVWYNAEEFLNIRFGTVPAEDVFYGAFLILLNLLLFEYLLKRRSDKHAEPINQSLLP